MSRTFEAVIRNEFPQMESLASALQQFAEEHNLAHGLVYKLNLAVEEMVSNIIKYGYDDAHSHEIGVHVSLEDGGATLRIEDDGHAFNPLDRPEPDTNKPLEQREIGGLGIHLVRNMCEDMRYRRDNGRNILEIRLSDKSE